MCPDLDVLYEDLQNIPRAFLYHGGQLDCRGDGFITLISTSISKLYFFPKQVLSFIDGDNILQSASFFVDWVYPGTPEHPILILLEIINWSIGLIMFVFFICKASNRALVADMLPSSLVDEDAVTLRTYSSQISSDSASAMMTQDTKRFNHFK